MPNQTQDDADAEFAAMQTVYSTLKPLEEDAQGRVLGYILDRLNLSMKSPARGPASRAAAEYDDETPDEGGASNGGGARTFENFAELDDAAQPKSNPEKALVAGYWLQVCQGADSFDSQSANTALKHLGEGIANITSALESLKTQKPALVLQLKKSGKTRQARKVYKITTAGIKAVQAMMDG